MKSPQSFSCLRCGACCRGEGSAFLYPDDIKNIAAFLEKSVQQVADLYCEYILLELLEDTGSYFYLPYLILKKQDNACIFLRDNLCEIQNAKPVQCCQTPFVEEFFSDAEWQEEIRELCPGFKHLNAMDIAKYKDAFAETINKEDAYYRLLKENSYNLEHILGITLPSPRIISFSEEE